MRVTIIKCVGIPFPRFTFSLNSQKIAEKRNFHYAMGTDFFYRIT